MRLSGEHRKYLSDCSKDGLSKKKSWVGIFIVARQWGQGEGCHMQEEAYMDFWNSHKCQGRQHPDFLISFSRCKTEEEGEGWQQSNVKNQRLGTNIYNPELHPLFWLFIAMRVLVAQLCLTLATPRTVTCQSPLSMEFSRWEYSSG